MNKAISKSTKLRPQGMLLATPVKWLAFALPFAVLASILCLRPFTFNAMIDNYTYAHYAIGYKSVLGYDIVIREPLFRLLLFVFGLMENPRVVAIAITFALISFYFYFLVNTYNRGHVSLPIIALIVITNPTFLVLSANLWRQFLAAILVCFSIYFNRNTLKSSIFFSLAVMTHFSSIILIPALFVSRLRCYKAFILTLCIFSYIGFSVILPVVIKNNVLNDSTIFARYSGYFNNTGLNESLRRGKLIIDLLVFYYLVGPTPRMKAAMTMGLMLLTIPYDGVFARFAHYPFFLMLAAFPELNSKKKLAHMIILWLFVENIVTSSQSETVLRALGVY